MDINMNLNVTVNAPGLVEALGIFANSLTAGRPLETAASAVKAEEHKRTRSNKHAADKTPAAVPEPEHAEVAASEPETAATTEEPAPEPTPESEPEKETASTPVITLEEVREKLATISRSGKTPQVKELLKSFGVSKLTDIPEEKFAELLEKAEKL